MAITIRETIEVDAPIDEVWAYVSDPPQVVPCLPGAELVRVLDEETYEGKVQIKVGPVTASYKGTVVIEDMDTETRTMTLVARGDQEGSVGRAEARVQFTMEPVGDRTRLHMNASIKVSGRLMQLGGTMIQSVSKQIFSRFGTCLEKSL